ncbi:MAG: SCO family protein [Myxococcaceae bacterium]|nr:SCO family protein [Myxococcaceae bacterium]
MGKLLVAVAALAVLSLAAVVALRLSGRGPDRAERFADQGARQTLAPLWPAPDFAFPDQHGRTVTAASLRGKVWVADFVFTRCRTLCPMLTAKFVQLQRRLAGVDVAFVSFSVDPANDTPEVLAAYARQWASDEPRWSLLATGATTLPPLVKGFRVTAAPSEAGAVDPIVHSSVFVLVDGQGQVRGVFDSEEREDFEALQRGVRALAAPAAPVEAPALEPAAQYHALGCASCHERPELAPALDGLAGQRRTLDNGLLAVADAAYVREAIVAPEARRVRGYPLRMPSYDGLLAPAELDALVAWVLARPKAGQGAAEAGLAEDPICHMAVRVVDDTPRVVSDGGTEYFCSSLCRERYLALAGLSADAGR